MAEFTLERVTAKTPEALEAARALFVEYHEWLGEVVCSARLAEEIASLPGPYSPPQGRLLLARDAATGQAVGTIGVRPFEAERCEMKRLYVVPSARGAGLGRVLAVAAIGSARELGYSEVLLTTLPETMDTALALYRSLGFAKTEPFMDHSHAEKHVPMLFMRLPL